MLSRRGKAAALAAVFVIISGFLLIVERYAPVDSNLLTINILDVGQGDAILLEAPRGQTILIDGGPDKKVLRRLGEELPFWERRIDLVVMSHPHEDHIFGLAAVMERYEIGVIMLTGVEAHSPTYDRLLALIKEKNIPLYTADHAEEISFDDLKLKILYPLKSFSGQRIANLNNSSIVIKASYKDIDLLLTEDAEEPEEKELLASGIDLEAEILKAGHHGSETSSSEAFLKAVKPRVALISDGTGNSYGHPSPRTLKRLERLGIAFRRTDLEGTIRMQTDGYAIYE